MKKVICLLSAAIVLSGCNETNVKAASVSGVANNEVVNSEVGKGMTGHASRLWHDSETIPNSFGSATIWVDIDNDGIKEFVSSDLDSQYLDNVRTGKYESVLRELSKQYDEIYLYKFTRGLLDDTDLIENTTCIHARKSIAVDLDNNGYTDIVVACHGIDIFPRPAKYKNKETGYVVAWMNNGGDSFTETVLTPAGYYHSLDAGDFDGDGDLDIIVATGKEAYVFQNNDMKFSRSNLFTKRARGIYSVMLPDVDNDGDFDVVIGGESIGKIYYNDAGKFKRNKAVPSVDAHSFIQDAIVYKNNMYIQRNNSRYESSAIQKVNLDTWKSELIQEIMCEKGEDCWGRWVSLKEYLGGIYVTPRKPEFARDITRLVRID